MAKEGLDGRELLCVCVCVCVCVGIVSCVEVAKCQGGEDGRLTAHNLDREEVADH